MFIFTIFRASGNVKAPPKTIILDSGATKALKQNQEKYTINFGDFIVFKVRTSGLRNYQKARAEKPSRLLPSILRIFEYGCNMFKMK